MKRHATVLIPLILLAACGSSGPQHTARLLDERLNTDLAPDVAAGRATVQTIDGGNRVTLLGLASFASDPRTDGQDPDARANVIEALLDPSLMRVEVADTSTLPPYQRDTRVQNVQHYFVTNGLESVLVPSGPDVAAGASGLVLTIHVACPPPNGPTGYGDGRSHPVCD
jgi:hypothetical protein